jgi:hypothetical protein
MDSTSRNKNKKSLFVAWEKLAPRANPIPTFDANQRASISYPMNGSSFINPQFAVMTPHSECAPVADMSPCLPAVTGASNSGALHG